MGTSVLDATQQTANPELFERLTSLTRPKGVLAPVFTYGADHSGDDALWIVFPVTADVRLTKGRIKTLFAFSETVRFVLGELQVKEITYVRFREMDQDASAE